MADIVPVPHFGLANLPLYKARTRLRKRHRPRHLAIAVDNAFSTVL